MKKIVLIALLSSFALISAAQQIHYYRVVDNCSQIIVYDSTANALPSQQWYNKAGLHVTFDGIHLTITSDFTTWFPATWDASTITYFAPTLDSGARLLRPMFSYQCTQCAGATQGPTGATGPTGTPGATGAAGVTTPDTLYITGGRYLPDTAATVNVHAFSVFTASFTQIDSLVHVAGSFNAKVNSTAQQGQVNFKLPIPAGLYPFLVMNGHATCVNANFSGAVLQGSGNTVQLQWYAPDTNQYLFKYSYDYVTDSPMVGKIVQGGIVGPTGPTGGSGYWTQNDSVLYPTNTAYNFLLHSQSSLVDIDTMVGVYKNQYAKSFFDGLYVIDDGTLEFAATVDSNTGDVSYMQFGKEGFEAKVGNINDPTSQFADISVKRDATSMSHSYGGSAVDFDVNINQPDSAINGMITLKKGRTYFQNGVYAIDYRKNGNCEVSVYDTVLKVDQAGIQIYRDYDNCLIRIKATDTASVPRVLNAIDITNISKIFELNLQADTLLLAQNHKGIYINQNMITVGTTLRYPDGNQGAGKFLASDASGKASWQAPIVTGATGSEPLTPFLFQQYGNTTTHKMEFWDGTQWVVYTSTP